MYTTKESRKSATFTAAAAVVVYLGLCLVSCHKNVYCSPNSYFIVGFYNAPLEYEVAFLFSVIHFKL